MSLRPTQRIALVAIAFLAAAITWRATHHPRPRLAPITTAGVGYNFCLYNQDYCSSTALTITVNGGSVLLAGQITATQAGTITTVSTQIGVCDRSISPYTCTTTGANTSPGGTFTSTAITPVSVSSGQIVQVSVTISFS